MSHTETNFLKYYPVIWVGVSGAVFALQRLYMCSVRPGSGYPAP